MIVNISYMVSGNSKPGKMFVKFYILGIMLLLRIKYKM